MRILTTINHAYQFEKTLLKSPQVSSEVTVTAITQLFLMLCEGQLHKIKLEILLPFFFFFYYAVIHMIHTLTRD